MSIIPNQQGWLLHWEHPSKNVEKLRHYTVNWWKEPEHFLLGTSETFDNFYQIRQLKEEALYKIQVIANSVDGEQIPSQILDLEVSSHRKVKALLIGSSVCIIFLLCALAAFLYVKRSCLQHLFTGTLPETACSGDSETGDDNSMNEKDIKQIADA